MEYPTLNVKEKFREVVDVFNGYNHNLRIGDGEFYDMKNMTSDYYPVLAPRKKRVVYREGVFASGLIAKDELCWINESEFVIGDDHIKMRLTIGSEFWPKNLISMGAYVIILPDKKWINTIPLPKENEEDENEYEWGSIDAEFTTTEKVEFTMCTIAGEDYEIKDIGSTTAPVNPETGEPDDGQLWIDKSSTPHTLKKYSKSNKMWVSIATTYIKISSKGIGKNFKQYDGVKISGVTVESLTDLNSYHALWERGDDYIVVAGMLDEVATQNGEIKISRKMPDMDYIVEANNRLWGCKYGINEDGVLVNEIYASKLGDFKNWNCFMGVSTDSWVGSIGSDGPFTGAASHLGYPLFFKENCVHKVYGNYPANFQIQNTPCRGVQEGSYRSLAVVNGILYYKSRGAVCAYDGSLPVEISDAFGEVLYSDAVACAHGNKYYITMKDAGDIYHLFVYDTAKNLWHKEDNLYVGCFCSYKNELYAISSARNIVVIFGYGYDDVDKGKVPWMVETGLIGMSMPDMKYVSKLMIRMSLALGSKVRVFVQYDSIGEWEQVCQMTSTSLRSFSVPIRPRRCDHFRIRIEGEGDGRIYSITRTVERGSDFS